MSNPAAASATLVIERVFPHPPQKLWRALTESRLLAEWLLSNNFEPIAGRRFQFQREPMPNWNGTINCEVQIVEPLRRLAYTWGSLGLETLVQWTLTPTEGGTRLRMEQSGFASEQDRAYKGAKYGWQNFLNGFERALDNLNAIAAKSAIRTNHQKGSTTRQRPRTQPGGKP
jgi:uncharacterized protein YndB with AHSA1/START domain